MKRIECPKCHSTKIEKIETDIGYFDENNSCSFYCYDCQSEFNVYYTVDRIEALT